ncbi:MAG: sulfite exporter TauE/SafE family protein [Chloroflexi bacterium]|nr:sulfite exporter TauE/SafE family protein [Chloroflexota bacterium]
MGLWLWVTVIAAGAVGQFVDAVAGMGFGAFSGSVMIAGGLPPAVVVGTVSLAKVSSGLFSGLAHWRFGNVRRMWVAPLAIPAIAGGILAATLVTRLPEAVTRFWVPVVLLAMGALILRRSLSATMGVPRVAGASQDEAPTDARGPVRWLRRTLRNVPSNLWLGSIGLLGGLLQGLSGAFGPFATSSTLLVKGGHPRYAIGTVNFVEFFLATAVAATVFLQLDWTPFRWELPLALMVGGILTAPLGAYLARHLPERGLLLAIGVLLLGINLWTIVRALA